MDQNNYEAHKVAEKLFSDKEWRAEQNKIAGKNLTVKQMYDEAYKQAIKFIVIQPKGN